MPLIGASLHSSYSPETMELPIIGICPPEKAMEIINNWFTPPPFFFPVMLTYNLQIQTEISLYKGAKFVQTVPGWPLSCMKFTLSRDKF